MSCIKQTKPECPLCRSSITTPIRLDKEYQEMLKVNFAQEYNEKLAQQKELTFLVGNTYSVIEATDKSINQHRWTAFVKADFDIGRLISKVRFGLHPTFKVSHRDVSAAPFKITYIGWGVFEMPITIHFKKETGLEKMKITHMLKFQDGGSSRAVTIQVDRKIAEKILK